MSIDLEPIGSTLATLNLSEWQQFGRASSTRWCEASFLAVLLSVTSDPDSIEAAMRGRRDALGEVATPVEVRILWRSETSVTAAVRDPVGGVVDVHWSARDGSFGCSCGDLSFWHREAVRQTLEAVAS